MSADAGQVAATTLPPMTGRTPALSTTETSNSVAKQPAAPAAPRPAAARRRPVVPPRRLQQNRPGQGHHHLRRRNGSQGRRMANRPNGSVGELPPHTPGHHHAHSQRIVALTLVAPRPV